MAGNAARHADACKQHVLGVAPREFSSDDVVRFRSDYLDHAAVKRDVAADSSFLPVRRELRRRVVDPVDEEAVRFVEVRALSQQRVVTSDGS